MLLSSTNFIFLIKHIDTLSLKLHSTLCLQYISLFFFCFVGMLVYLQYIYPHLMLVYLFNKLNMLLYSIFVFQHTLWFQLWRVSAHTYPCLLFPFPGVLITFVFFFQCFIFSVHFTPSPNKLTESYILWNHIDSLSLFLPLQWWMSSFVFRVLLVVVSR